MLQQFLQCGLTTSIGHRSSAIYSYNCLWYMLVAAHVMLLVSAYLPYLRSRRNTFEVKMNLSMFVDPVTCSLCAYFCKAGPDLHYMSASMSPDFCVLQCICKITESCARSVEIAVETILST